MYGEAESLDAPPRAPVARASGEIRASFTHAGQRTSLARLHESGGLRLKFPKVPKGCEGVIVNTAGGMVAGDRASFAFEAAPGAHITLTTQAAEKIYRSDGPTAHVGVSLTVDAGACLEWLPQETILFHDARLNRKLEAQLAPDASLTIVESVVFGRLQMGEASVSGALIDNWRIRRGGKMVFADYVRLEGAMGEILDRAATGAGARAVATLLHVTPDAEARIDALRAAVAMDLGPGSLGISGWNGMIVARLCSPSPDRVRAGILSLMSELRGRDAPRVWQ